MLCVIGGGKMGSAIAAGLLAGGLDEVTVVETDDASRAELQRRFPSAHIAVEPVACDVAIIAVKPHGATQATKDAVAAGAKAVVSIAAGVRLKELRAAAAGAPLVRAMPNIGAVNQKSATAYASDGDGEWAERILKAFGSVVKVDESDLDAVTGLSGSGPAYVFLVVEAMTQAGVDAGLSAETAEVLAVATVQGAAELLDQKPAADLRQMVTTPNGTTAAGLAELERHGVRQAFSDAVRAATARSVELGNAK